MVIGGGPHRPRLTPHLATPRKRLSCFDFDSAYIKTTYQILSSVVPRPFNEIIKAKINRVKKLKPKINTEKKIKSQESMMGLKLSGRKTNQLIRFKVRSSKC